MFSCCCGNSKAARKDKDKDKHSKSGDDETNEQEPNPSNESQTGKETETKVKLNGNMSSAETATATEPEPINEPNSKEATADRNVPADVVIEPETGIHIISYYPIELRPQMQNSIAC